MAIFGLFVMLGLALLALWMGYSPERFAEGKDSKPTASPFEMKLFGWALLAGVGWCVTHWGPKPEPTAAQEAPGQAVRAQDAYRYDLPAAATAALTAGPRATAKATASPKPAYTAPRATATPKPAPQPAPTMSPDVEAWVASQYGIQPGRPAPPADAYAPPAGAYASPPTYYAPMPQGRSHAPAPLPVLDMSRQVHVREHTRKDGTHVREHTRSAPGRGHGKRH